MGVHWADVAELKGSEVDSVGIPVNTYVPQRSTFHQQLVSVAYHLVYVHTYMEVERK